MGFNVHHLNLQLYLRQAIDRRIGWLFISFELDGVLIKVCSLR